VLSRFNHYPPKVVKIKPATALHSPYFLAYLVSFSNKILARCSDVVQKTIGAFEFSSGGTAVLEPGNRS